MKDSFFHKIKIKGANAFVISITLILAIGFSLATASTEAKIADASPINVSVHHVSFNANKATLHFKLPMSDKLEHLSLEDTSFETIADLANKTITTLPVIQQHDGAWRHYTSYAFLISLGSGLFLTILSTLFASQFTLFHKASLRMLYPLFLVLIMWGIHLAYGSFHWTFLLYPLPPIIGWKILQPRKRVKHTFSVPPSLSWKARFAIIFIGLLFLFFGISAQWWCLTSAQTTYNTLFSRKDTILTPHLSKTSILKRKHGVSSRSHVLVSYKDESQTPHFVALDESIGNMLNANLRKIAQQNFQALYNGYSVKGSVATNNPNNVYPCSPTLADTLLSNERIRDMNIFHGIRLFSLPFYFLGLTLLSVPLTLLLIPKRFQAFHNINKPMPQIYVVAFTLIVLPITLAFSLYQWLNTYQKLAYTTPWYTFAILLLPVLATLVALISALRQMKHTGIYRLKTKQTTTGMTLQLSPPSTNAPKILAFYTDKQKQILHPIPSTPNTWLITWTTPPHILQVKTPSGPYFIIKVNK